MSVKLLLLNTDKAKSSLNIGYSFLKNNQSRLIACNAAADFLTATTKGIHYFIYQDKAYMVMKQFFDVASNTLIALCTESINGCDLV